MYRVIVLFCLFLITSPVLAQEAAIAWLKKNSIDAAGDMAGVKKAIGNARIVMLGEQTHGDGTTFEWKTNLIKYLHQEMGFDVLCMESGIYDCRRAWQALQSGANAKDGFEEGVFPIWTTSRSFFPLMQYVKDSLKSKRPLELCGYDCQMTGPDSENLIRELEAIIKASSAKSISSAPWGKIKKALQLMAEGGVAENIEQTLKPILNAFESGALGASLSKREQQFWHQVTRNLVGLCRHRLASKQSGVPLAQVFNPRDEQGAENMLWLARERYPDRKIIVWAASMHIIRDHGALKPLSKTLNYDSTRSMGDRVCEVLGDDVYVVSFTTHSGQAGLPWTKPWAVAKPIEGSFEDLCGRAGLQDAFIPIRGKKVPFLSEPIVARPLGNSPMKAQWQRHVDAFFFNRTMKRSATYYSPKQVESHRDIIAALEKKAASYRAGLKSKHSFADKGDFSFVWEKWLDIFEPSPELLAKTQKAVLEWAGKQKNDPAITWRALSLEGQIARDHGDTTRAARAFSEALASYGHRRHKEPLRQSARQHLMNRKAMSEWDRVGFEDALKSATEWLETDESYHWFHADPWLNRLDSDISGAKKLHEAVIQAYDKRANRYPAEVERIEKYKGYLDRWMQKWLKDHQTP